MLFKELNSILFILFFHSFQCENLQFMIDIRKLLFNRAERERKEKNGKRTNCNVSQERHKLIVLSFSNKYRPQLLHFPFFTIFSKLGVTVATVPTILSIIMKEENKKKIIKKSLNNRFSFVTVAVMTYTKKKI